MAASVFSEAFRSQVYLNKKVRPSVSSGTSTASLPRAYCTGRRLQRPPDAQQPIKQGASQINYFRILILAFQNKMSQNLAVVGVGVVVKNNK